METIKGICRAIGAKIAPLYANVGKKIKTLALVLFVLETVLFVCGGLLLILAGSITAIVGGTEGAYALISGLFGGGIYIILGPVIAWLSTLMLYGTGELIDNSAKIARNTQEVGAEQTEQSEAMSNF